MCPAAPRLFYYVVETYGFARGEAHYGSLDWHFGSENGPIIAGVAKQFNKDPVDLMFVMDRSGSMNDDCPGGDADPGETPCKMNDAKDAAKFFVDLMNPVTDQAGLASFNESASLDHSLSFNHVSVKGAIDALKEAGWTAIGSGINTANNELLANGRNNSVWVQILLTNGQLLYYNIASWQF